MIKKLKALIYWIFNLFTFSKPFFVSLEYVDVVVNQKAIFLLSWEIKKAHSIHIPELKFQSFQKHASAYLSVPEEISYITLKISNSWRSKIKTIKLQRTEMNDQMDFNIKPNFKEFNKRSISIPSLQLQSRRTKLKPMNFEVIKIKIPKIKNLNYS
jgi:hypothetical protein